VRHPAACTAPPPVSGARGHARTYTVLLEVIHHVTQTTHFTTTVTGGTQTTAAGRRHSRRRILDGSCNRDLRQLGAPVCRLHAGGGAGSGAAEGDAERRAAWTWGSRPRGQRATRCGVRAARLQNV
jgi:hypothetical protein